MYDINETEYGITQEKWNEFKTKYGITDHDLDNRRYDVDTEEVSLKELIESNCKCVWCDDVMKLNEFIPFDEIIKLGVGGVYESHGMGCDVKRIK